MSWLMPFLTSSFLVQHTIGFRILPIMISPLHIHSRGMVSSTSCPWCLTLFNWNIPNPPQGVHFEYEITIFRIFSFPLSVSAHPRCKISVYLHQLANPFQGVSCTYFVGIHARKWSSLSIHIPVCAKTHSSRQIFGNPFTLQKGVLERVSW